MVTAVTLHLRTLILVAHRGRSFIVDGLNPDNSDDSSNVVVSEYSETEVLMWVLNFVTSNVDLANERSVITRDLCIEMIAKAHNSMIKYSASQLGIRCAARGIGFYVLLNADATAAEVIDGDPPAYVIIIATFNTIATAEIIEEINDQDESMEELMAFLNTLMRMPDQLTYVLTQLARQIFGSNEDQVALWFFGDTQIGKTTFLSLIKSLLAESEVALVEHWQYEKVTSQIGLLEPLLKAVLVMTNELEFCKSHENGTWDEKTITNWCDLNMRKVASKEEIQVNVKNHPVRTVKSGALLCVSTNNPIMSRGCELQDARRFVMIACSQSFMPSGHIKSSYHRDLLERCGPALVKLLLDHLQMATLHPILRGKPVTSAALENIMLRDIPAIAGNCRLVHFLPTLGSDHVSIKDFEKATTLGISPNVQPRNHVLSTRH